MYIPLDAIFFTLAFDYLIKFKSNMSEFGFYNSFKPFCWQTRDPWASVVTWVSKITHTY